MKDKYDILSDGEQLEAIQRLRESYKTKLFKSSNLLSKTFDVVVDVVKASMQGTEQEKTERIHKRLKQMYNNQIEAGEMKENYCKKREPNYDRSNPEIYPVFNEIIVFGTDWWPTKKIKSSLRYDFINFQVYKLDQSHTKIIFDSPNDAKNWLISVALNPKLLVEKIEEEQTEDIENSWTGWIQLKPYEYFSGMFQKRQARYATSQENDIQAEKSKGIDLAMQKIKEKVAKQILEEHQVEEKFDEIMEYRRNIEDQCYRSKNRKSMKYPGSTYQRNKINRHNASQCHCYSPNSVYRERSREKPLAQSCFLKGNNSVQAASRVVPQEDMEYPLEDMSNLSYGFLLSDGEKSMNSNDMSFVKQFDKKLNMSSNPNDQRNGFKKHKEDELENLLESSQIEQKGLDLSFGSKKSKRNNPNFNYSEYMEELEKSNKDQIIEL